MLIGHYYGAAKIPRVTRIAIYKIQDTGTDK